MKEATQTIEDYLYLLRCALWEQRPQRALLDDWNGVVRLAQQQTTLGLVGHAALQCDAVSQLLPESRERLQQQVKKMEEKSRRCEQLISQVMKSLQDHDIGAFLLKGQGLAALYPRPSLRHCGDIDLLVSPANFENAIAVLNQMATDDAVAKAFTTDKHYHIHIGGFSVELHHRCMSLPQAEANSLYQSIEKEALALPPDDFALDGVAIHRPEATFNVFYVFLHLWEHFLERGIGLRQICDWAMLLHRRNAQIDADRLGRMIDALGLRQPWQLFGALAVGHLGLPQEEMPYYSHNYGRKARRLLRIILKEGNFGKSMTLRQQHTRQHGLGRRLTTLLSIQVRSWRIFTLLPTTGWRLWKQKMIGGINK